MGKAIPISLGRLSFEKKGDALLLVRETLNRYSPGDRVAPDDEELLWALIKRHPDALLKIGNGIDHFTVRSADYGTQCFWVVRIDGSTERFSYKECL